MSPVRLTGIIESGAGKGAFFTRLEWVVTQFEEAMGFEPFPGTLNIRVKTDEGELAEFLSAMDFEIRPDDPQFCAAQLKRVWVDGIPGALVLPSEDVRIHPKGILEVIAGRHIKSELGLSDGDTVRVTDYPVEWQGRCIRGLVFDLDGTLTDSIDVYYGLFREVLEDAGLEISREDVMEPLSEGLGSWEKVVPSDLPDREERLRRMKKRFRTAFVQALDRVSLLPGVEHTLTLLAERGIGLGLVTDSPETSLKPLRERSLDRLFQGIVTRDDGLPRKPAAEGIIECLRRMGVSPDNAVTVGDALLDIRAGNAAGTLTIGVATGMATPRQFEAEPPTALVRDVSEIPELMGLT